MTDPSPACHWVRRTMACLARVSPAHSFPTHGRLCSPAPARYRSPTFLQPAMDHYPLTVVLPSGCRPRLLARERAWVERIRSCLLYTSDAADERSSVDLGGR